MSSSFSFYEVLDTDMAWCRGHLVRRLRHSSPIARLQSKLLVYVILIVDILIICFFVLSIVVKLIVYINFVLAILVRLLRHGSPIARL